MSPLADACLYRGAAPRCEATGCCCTPACGGAGCAFWRCRLPGRSSYTPRVPGCALRGSLRPRRLSRLLLLVLAPRHCLRLVVVGQIRLGRAAPGRTAQRIPRPSSLLLHDSSLSLALLHVPRSRSPSTHRLRQAFSLSPAHTPHVSSSSSSFSPRLAPGDPHIPWPHAQHTLSTSLHPRPHSVSRVSRLPRRFVTHSAHRVLRACSVFLFPLFSSVSDLPCPHLIATCD